MVDGVNEKGYAEQKLTRGLYLVPVTMSHPVCCWCLQEPLHCKSATSKLIDITEARCHIDSSRMIYPTTHKYAQEGNDKQRITDYNYSRLQC